MNILLQLGIGPECSSLLELVSTRHSKFCERHEAAYYDDTEAIDNSKHVMFEKWRQISFWLDSPGAELVIAADCDCIWQDGRQNIFDALPKDRFIGVTHIHGVPSAGVIWIRNSPESRRFVSKVLDLEDEFRTLAGHDQSAMIAVSKRFGFEIYRIEDRWHGESESSVLRGFHRLHSQRLELMRATLDRLSLRDAVQGQSEAKVREAYLRARYLQFL